MAEMEKLNMQDLDEVAGGKNHFSHDSGRHWHEAKAHVQTGYLALRRHPEWDDSNIKRKINNGVHFKVDTHDKENGYYYAKYDGDYGWVNASYVKLL